MMAMGMLKRSKGQFWIKEVIAVAEVPIAELIFAFNVVEVGTQTLPATQLT